MFLKKISNEKYFTNKKFYNKIFPIKHFQVFSWPKHLKMQTQISHYQPPQMQAQTTTKYTKSRLGRRKKRRRRRRRKSHHYCCHQNPTLKYNHPHHRNNHHPHHHNNEKGKKIQDQWLMKTHPNRPPSTPKPTPNAPPLNWRTINHPTPYPTAKLKTKPNHQNPKLNPPTKLTTNDPSIKIWEMQPQRN